MQSLKSPTFSTQPTAPDLKANSLSASIEKYLPDPCILLLECIMFWCHPRVAAKAPISQCGSVVETVSSEFDPSYCRMLAKSFVMKPTDRTECSKHVWSHFSHGIAIFTKQLFTTYQIHVTCCLHSGWCYWHKSANYSHMGKNRNKSANYQNKFITHG